MGVGGGTSFDVLLRFITEMVGEDEAKKTVASMGGLKKQIDESNKLLEKQNSVLKDWKSQLKDLKLELESVRKGGAAYKQIEAEIMDLNESINNGTAEVNDNRTAHQKLVAQLRAEEQQQKLTTQTAIKASTTLTRMASTLHQISNTLVIGGTAVVGGIFKAAKDFIDSTEAETALTREWKKQTDSISTSYKEVGQVAATEILPFLKEAATIADKIAGFAQQNPGAVGAAVQIGVIALAVGVIGKAVASGIKLIADITYIAATTVQLLASEEFAAGVGVFATTVGVVLLPALVIIAGILSGVLVGLIAYEGIAKASGGKIPDLETLGTQSLTILKAKTKEIWDEFNRGADKGALAVQKFGENTDKLVDAFSKMQSDLSAANKKYEAERAKIIADASASSIKATHDSAEKIKSINEKAATDRASITSKFVEGSKKDQAKFEADRANIIRDGGIEIQRIEADRLEKLRQLEMDHSDRVDELAANRDALGLVLEQRKFDRDKAEVDRSTNIEIAKRRQDLAIKLQDLQANYAAERAQKQAQFIQDIKENEAKRQEEIKQERADQAARQKEISANRAQALRELSQQHAEEQKRIRENFLATVRDLDASLLNEQNAKRQAYSKMLTDLDQFLAQERAKKNSGNNSGVGGGALPQRAGGGYVNGEVVQTHGVEFITSASTTRSLESIIGGRLNQQNLIAATMGGGDNMNVSVRNRYDGTYTKAMKREVEQSTFDAIKMAFKKRSR